MGIGKVGAEAGYFLPANLLYPFLDTNSPTLNMQHSTISRNQKNGLLFTFHVCPFIRCIIGHMSVVLYTHVVCDVLQDDHLRRNICLIASVTAFLLVHCEWNDILVSHLSRHIYSWQCKTMVTDCEMKYSDKTVVINRAFGLPLIKWWPI